MRNVLFPALLALATFGLVACITPPAPPMTDSTPSETASCNADAAKPNAMGKVASAAVTEQARKDAGARIARVLKPGQMVTMEYAEGRLNIDVDGNNVIINLRCG